jgi:enoyl-CoA hydratase/carnithine racemase
VSGQNEETVLYDKQGVIAIITLNRPHKANAVNAEMKHRLCEIWNDVRADRDLRVAIITGAGSRHFCTGLDLESSVASGGTLTSGVPLREAVPWSPLAAGVWKPILCVLNGLVAGGGLHFVADADIVVAANGAELMDTHTSVGLVGAIENIGLLRRLPIGAVLRLTLQGRPYRMSAERAYQLGLIDELAKDGEDPMVIAKEIAMDVASNSPTAAALSKQAIWAGVQGLEAAQEHGWALARMHWSHPDAQEGPAAFRERRSPNWTV